MRHLAILQYFTVLLFVVSGKTITTKSSNSKNNNKSTTNITSVLSKEDSNNSSISYSTKSSNVSDSSKTNNNNNNNNTRSIDIDSSNLQNEVRFLKMRISELEKERAAGYGICHFKKPCGDSGCKCIEDCNVPEQYYCDCKVKPIRHDCKEHYTQGELLNGIYMINNNITGSVVEVYCDHTTDGGGWTVVQRRMDGSENFYRVFDEYKRGFGKLQREHWIGNDNLHLLTAQGSEVRFDLVARGKNVREWVKYAEFSVAGRWSYYKLRISGFSRNGTFRDGLSRANGVKFSTYDKDNDQSSALHCARLKSGGWWYDYNTCSNVNLNGKYEVYKIPGLDQSWKLLDWYPHRLSFSEMKVRRK